MMPRWKGIGVCTRSPDHTPASMRLLRLRTGAGSIDPWIDGGGRFNHHFLSRDSYLSCLSGGGGRAGGRNSPLASPRLAGNSRAMYQPLSNIDLVECRPRSEKKLTKLLTGRKRALPRGSQHAIVPRGESPSGLFFLLFPSTCFTQREGPTTHVHREAKTRPIGPAWFIPHTISGSGAVPAISASSTSSAPLPRYCLSCSMPCTAPSPLDRSKHQCVHDRLIFSAFAFPDLKLSYWEPTFFWVADPSSADGTMCRRRWWDGSRAPHKPGPRPFPAARPSSIGSCLSASVSVNSNAFAQVHRNLLYYYLPASNGGTLCGSRSSPGHDCFTAFEATLGLIKAA